MGSNLIFYVILKNLLLRKFTFFWSFKHARITLLMPLAKIISWAPPFTPAFYAVFSSLLHSVHCRHCLQIVFPILE